MVQERLVYRMEKVATLEKTFMSENGTEIQFKIETVCSTSEEMRNTLSFMAQSSHRFYLELAEKISSML